MVNGMHAGKTWLLVALTMGLVFLTPVLAQEQRATRELENGLALARDGKLEQAVSAWTQVVDRYPDSPEAPLALDRLGTASYPSEGFAGRGRVAPADAARAREIFRRIVNDYRDAAVAPRALFKLGLMYADPSVSFYDLDEAYALFSTLVTVYPGSGHEDAGLYGMGHILGKQGQCARSLTPLSRLDAKFATSSWADDGLFLQAECLSMTDHRPEAMNLYQSIRDRYPESPLAVLARERNTHLVRLLGRSSGTIYQEVDLIRPQLEPDWQIRSVDDLKVDSQGQLYLVDGRLGVTHVMERSGAISGRTLLRKVSAVLPGEPDSWLFAEGSLVFKGESTVLIGPNGKTLTGPAGLLAADPLGRFVVWDQRSGDVVRFAQDQSFDQTLISSSDERVDAAAMGPDGTLVILDSKAMSLTFVGMDGKRRIVPVESDSLRRPDLMVMDFLGNVAIMDTSNRVVEMRDAQGGMMARITSGRAEGDLFPRPEALAINARGELLIYDQRRAGIVVLR